MTFRLLTLDDIDPHWADGPNPRWRRGAALGEPGGMTVPVAEVFVHHTVSPDSGDVVADVAGPCDTDQRNFTKVSYSWNIHPSTSSVIEVEGTHRGAHTINNAQQSLNGISFGFGVIGNFHAAQPVPTPRVPTDADIELIAETIVEMVVKPGLVVPDFVIKGHRDAPYATACCGDSLYARLPDIRAAVKRLSTIRKVDKMLALVTGDNDPQGNWYLTDYLHRWHIPSDPGQRDEVLAEIATSTAANGVVFERDASAEHVANGRIIGSRPVVRTQVLIDSLLT